MQARGRSEEGGIRSSDCPNKSGPTIIDKARWFLVALLSVGVLLGMFLLWGDATGEDINGTGLLAFGLVALILMFVVGTAMAQLCFAFVLESGWKGPAKALTIFATGCLALSALMWEGTVEDVYGALMVGVMGSILFSLPGVLMFVRSRAKEDQRARQDADCHQREADEEAKQAGRERLKREQEERKREQTRRSKGGRNSSRGSGGNRRSDNRV
jgi:hypothetical protein